MESLSNVVRVSLPNYLRDLPIPTTVFGWFQLGLGDRAKLLPFGTVAAGISYLAVQGLANAPGVGPVIKVTLLSNHYQKGFIVSNNFLITFSFGHSLCLHSIIGEAEKGSRI